MGCGLALLLACSSADDVPTPPSATTIGAPGVHLTAVAMYQGPERMLMAGGAAVESSVPLVAGRDALVRVFYTTDDDYDGRQVTAVLSLDGEPLEQVTTLYESSLPHALLSTVNFRLDGESVKNGSYAVEITQQGDAARANVAARYPGSGEEPLPAMLSGQTIRVMLVPLSYEADGSGRLPDTSSEQLERYRQELYSLFPLAAVELTVHEPVAFTSPLTTTMSPALDVVLQLRAAEAPDDAVYYHGLVNNAETLVGSGDIGGLAATIDMADDPTLRASVGVGFTGPQAASIFVHELGHLHGRYHSPCGAVVGADPDYPHPFGGVGVTGYDLVREELRPMADVFDVMGYCEPRFISDHNYTQVGHHIQQVSGAMMASWQGVDHAQGEGQPGFERHWFERVSLHADGTRHWLTPVERRAVAGAPTLVRLRLDDGRALTMTGHLSRFDHGAGGILHLERTVAMAGHAILRLESVAGQ